MGRHPNNKVWEYFDYVSEKIAKCRSCRAKITTPGTTRGNLVRHLYHIHGINTYTAGPKVGVVLNQIPSKRGREFDESLKEGEHSTFRKFEHETSIEASSECIRNIEESYFTQSHDDGSQSNFDNVDNESNTCSQSHHSLNEIFISTDTPIIKVRSDSNLKISYTDKNKQIDDGGRDDNDQNDAANISITDPLLDLNMESLDHHPPCQTSNSIHLMGKHDYRSPTPESPPLQNCTSKNSTERLKAEALAEKLLAEARYFNELADLTRSKRIYVDLQCQKIRNQLKRS